MHVTERTALFQKDEKDDGVYNYQNAQFVIVIVECELSSLDCIMLLT
jgi:hypothetical protein